MGGAIKLWPMLILPAVAIDSMRQCPGIFQRAGRGCTVIAAGVLAFAIPHIIMLMLGTSLSDVFGYATFARDRPLDILSVPGNVIVLFNDLGAETQVNYSYGSDGIVVPGAIQIERAFQLMFLTAYAASLSLLITRRLTSPGFSNLAGLIVCVAVLTSKVYNAPYMIWFYPFYLIALSLGQWKAPLFYLSVILSFKILSWSGLDPFAMGLSGTLLVLLKNCLSLGLAIAFARAVHSSEQSDPGRARGARHPPPP